MVLPKSKNTVGLGNSLMNDRFGRGKGGDRKKVSAQQGVVRTNHATGESYVTNSAKEASWVKMKSVTEQGALDDFLSTAELAGTDFTAHKMNNVSIIHADQRNPYLLSATEEKAVRKKAAERRDRLRVPRRPKWDEKTTPRALDEMERAVLLEWRRGLAELQENEDLLMTPFERNIEVWRQLWRVIERSDLIVQIVDGRNPMKFRCADLERYVKEVDPEKRNLLLVNKADMMTPQQRFEWANYFEGNSIDYIFFSAHLAKEEIERRGAAKDGEQHGVEAEEEAEEASEEKHSKRPPINDTVTAFSRRTRILTVHELEAVFLKDIPSGTKDQKITIGLVGYPNVGKSSTINALIGAKKVSVSATPGKTKHFQTIRLSEKVTLCDCPGLVFPNFATTKAELVCNGVLPIDQLREFTGPSELVVRRISQRLLESIYGIKIQTRPKEEGGTGSPTASDLLRAYASARGYATRHGEPDQSRAARDILKDYVSGKLLYCHPPPNRGES